jgi:hypothetical protein
MPASELEEYLRLFRPYEERLRDFQGREGPYGDKFALLFRQVIRRVVQHPAVPGTLHGRMPRPFVEVAQRYLAGEYETVRHFSYEENRHFYLSDLYDWLLIQERGERMRRLGR